MEDPAVLTVQEVADLLRVHHTTIRRYLKTGQLPVIRFGSKVRIPRAAVEALLRPVAEPLRDAS